MSPTLLTSSMPESAEVTQRMIVSTAARTSRTGAVERLASPPRARNVMMAPPPRRSERVDAPPPDALYPSARQVLVRVLRDVVEVGRNQLELRRRAAAVQDK